MAKYTITLSRQGGTGSPSPLYYSSNQQKFFVESGTYITSITPPTRSCYEFKGFYTAKTGGTKYINSNGSINSSFADAASENLDGLVLYAHWTRTHFAVTLDKNGGSGGTSTILTADDSTDTILSVNLNSISAITPPTRANYVFTGYRARTNGGSTYIKSDASFHSNLLDWAKSDDKDDLTVYANWEPVFWTVTLDKNGGSGGTSAIYTPKSGANVGKFYSNKACTSEISAISALPSRTGHTFTGYKASASGGSGYINDQGNINTNLRNWANGNPTADLTVYANWSANSYTLSFSGGNEGSTVSASITVTYGEAIGHPSSWPAHPTSVKGVFDYWTVNGKKIDNSTIWKWAGNKTAVPAWRYYWGQTTDYFNADGAVLMLVRSESGTARASVATAGVVVTTNGNIVTASNVGGLDIKTGNSATAGYWRGPELLNPVCTFRIKAAGLVSFTLGAAYSHAGGSFMLVGVEYRTAADGEPTLTLRGVANEGADAINTWPVSFSVSPDHTAQDPAGAVSGGGELLECTTTWSCDPVVVYIEGEPAASDVVHGKATVKATTAAYSAQVAPSAAGGFLAVDVPKAESDVDFTTYSFIAERSL